jgi:hypothetical protein
LLATDINTCSVDSSFQITQPQVLTVGATITSNFNNKDVSCFGANDGSVSALVNGGTAPYTYNWSNGQTTANLSGLFAGTYSLTVSDANGCTAQTSITLQEPDNIEIISNQVNVLCYGQATGSITSLISGGTFPYNFYWNNGQLSQNLNNIQSGNYKLVVTDLNGCQDSLETTIL